MVRKKEILQTQESINRQILEEQIESTCPDCGKLANYDVDWSFALIKDKCYHIYKCDCGCKWRIQIDEKLSDHVYFFFMVMFVFSFTIGGIMWINNMS